VWNVSGHYDVTPNLFLRGSAGTAFRLPDAYELYVIDPCCEQGNPNLEAEESINFNGSIGGRFPIAMGTAYAEAVGFYRKVSNRIEIVFDEDLGVDTFANSGPEVTVKGGGLIAGIDFGNVFSATFSYSLNSSQAEGTDVQLPDVPESLIKASFDYHPMTMPFGVSATLNHVGDVYRNAVGRQEFGGYTVVDLGARVFLDQDRRHRIGASVQNLFDTEYTTRVRTTTPDDGGSAYPYHFLGTPQTFRVNYSYSFGG
jgi:vitamin B12 transporter